MHAHLFGELVLYHYRWLVGIVECYLEAHSHYVGSRRKGLWEFALLPLHVGGGKNLAGQVYGGLSMASP